MNPIRWNKWSNPNMRGGEMINRARETHDHRCNGDTFFWVVALLSGEQAAAAATPPEFFDDLAVENPIANDDVRTSNPSGLAARPKF
mmetsp:Transcript_490/g.963  ORF Transcript_490/g.963 Transcript_490/m.963 type:complete len:87 (-) Transcript_490:459-719(-)